MANNRYSIRPRPRLLAVLLLTTLWGAVAICNSHDDQAPLFGWKPAVAAEDPAAIVDRTPGPRFLGADTCASAGCHANPHPARTAPLGREYRVWMREDPHSRAFQTLLSPKSQAIAAKLQLAQPAHRSAICLSCHATASDPDSLAANHRHTLRDGVSCEACHGPAEKWIAVHTRLEWRAMDADQRAALGFRNTSDANQRARLCAECHVGSSGRDVNHDLIAAGHPAMHYEFSGYLALLPRHWSRAKDRLEYGSTFAARLWEAGRLESAKAAAELTATRAANQRAPWPEFAEFDCFACHRDLGPQPSLASGQSNWNRWQLALLNEAVETSLEDAESIGRELTAMRRQMKVGQEVSRADATTAARNLAKILDDFLDGASELPAPTVDQLNLRFRKLVKQGAAADDSEHWATLTQRYLALTATRQALIDAADDAEAPAMAGVTAATAELRQLQQLLAFPRGQESPRLSPQDRNRIRALFAAMWQRLEPSQAEKVGDVDRR